MNSERLWVVIFSLTSLLVGVAVGVLLTLELRPQPVERGAFADYQQLLEESFELEPIRVRELHYLLERYHYDIESVKARNAAAVEPELRQLGLSLRGAIRDFVIPPSKRAEFDQLANGAQNADSEPSPNAG